MAIKTYSGFTLIELSIVLIIVGLVAGGVLIGRDLIKAAELRSVISDAQKVEVAINTFQAKYGALPGDMPNAEDIWGSDVSCPLTPANTIPKTETCNGNGDGLIRNLNAYSEYYEMFRAIQQLANAGLITGSYTGVRGPGSTVHTLTGLNIPRLKNFKAGMLVVHNDTALSGDHMYPGGHRIMQHIGEDVGGGSWNFKPFLTSEDAYWIDLKADDGFPGTGVWRSYKPGSYPDPDGDPYEPPVNHCATTDDATTARYDLSHKEIKCAFVHILRQD